MNRFLRAFALITAFILLINCSACKKSYQDALIYLELPEKPGTLDPQTASADAELLISRNIYEGLLRRNESGAIICGVAESFTRNKLSYTFKLRKNAVWSNGDPVTAKDFVFAFRRAVTPLTQSPFAMRLFAIKNAESIYKNKLTPNNLGVSAPDDYTLTIELIREDKNFENTLTTSVCMPCNEAFFNETAGKYGLSSECIISNGSYRLTKWNKETFGIRLYNNEEYTGSMKAKNAAVFITNDEKESAIEKLVKNSVDIAFIDSSISPSAKKNNLKTTDFQNICWVMTANSDLSSGLRKALTMYIGSDVYKDDLPNGYFPADSIYPSTVVEKPTSSGMTLYNPAEGKKIFTREIDKLPENKFPSSVRLHYFDNGVIKPVITDIVGHWQNNLGAFVNIEAIDSADKLLPQLTNQTLSLAVFPVRADTSDISEYLKKFGVTYSSESPNEYQTQILSNNHITPIAFQNTTIAYSPSLNDIYPRLGDGYIDFSLIIKTE